MGVNIRETEEADYEGILALLREAKRVDSEFTEEKFRKVVERNRGFCYVAETEGELIGTVFATHDGAFRGYLQKVVVAEPYWRRKVGTRLVKRVTDAFDSAGMPLITCHVNKKNLPSIGLLQPLGFEIRESHYLIDRGYKPR